FLLPLQKPLQLFAARLAPEESRRDDGNEEGHHIDRFFDPLPPLLSPGNVLPVLENHERFAGLHAHLSAEALAEIGQTSVLVLVLETHVAHETGWQEAHLGVTAFYPAADGAAPTRRRAQNDRGDSLDALRPARRFATLVRQ